MKIRALRTFSAYDGTQIHVFNAGKDGEPAETIEVTDKFGAECLATGHAEEVDAIPQLDHDGDGEGGGSLPHDPPALTGKNKAALLAIADAEGVAIEDGATNAAIVDAIEAARAEPADEADEEAPPA